MNIESFKVIYNERVINPIDVEPSFKDTSPVNSEPSISKLNICALHLLTRTENWRWCMMKGGSSNS